MACYSFSQFTALRSLTIAKSKVCDIPLLVASIGKLRALESLHISCANIGDSNTGMLAAALREHLSQLIELNICFDNLGEKAGQSIGSLVALGSLQKLVLKRTCIGDAGVSAMVDAILVLSKSHRCKLQQLNLRSSGIGPAGGIKLVELIAHSPHLRVLDLFCNDLGETAADALFKSLQLRSHSLEEFDVDCLDLDSRGVLLLLDTLSEFTELRVLKSRWNVKEDVCAHALAQFLLSFGGCRLGRGARQSPPLLRSPECNRSISGYALRGINLAVSPLGPRGAAAILDALAMASTMPMDAINFCNCEIGDAVASAVGRLILHRGCRNVHLFSNRIHSIGAKAIMDSAAISTTCVMNLLNLSYNPIGDEGVKYILDKMMQSRRRLVHKLNITRIEMGLKAAAAVVLAVEVYGIPYRLNVSRHVGDVVADDILERVKKLERDVRPSRAAILRFSW